MNVVMIIPTGIGCEIGGHAGDATPAARLLGACCDKLILHPNVVNASDINEMPANALYVEGSMLDRFLEGEIELQEVKQNRILVAVNAPARSESVNAVSAARATLGIDASIVELNHPLEMKVKMFTGGATGEVYGWKQLVDQVKGYDFDALAISSVIDCEEKVALNYLRHGGVNPWGGVEAIASKLIGNALDKPVAHAPIDPENRVGELKDFKEIVDPRMSAEVVSEAYLNCVLKGLHKAPRIVKHQHCGYGAGLNVRDVDCLVTPYGCWGRPHKACRGEMAIIIVKENKTICKASYPGGDDLIFVENYLEAAGLIIAMKEGINPGSVRRPLTKTSVFKIKDEAAD